MAIKRQGFSAMLLPPEPTPGEQVFAPVMTGTPSTPQSFSFIVPADVFELAALVVSVKFGTTPRQTEILRGATVLLSTADAIAGAVGGGNGGAGGAWGSGGVGGYAGNGGAGAATSTTDGGTAPAGGGGGGGAYGSSSGGNAGAGGGVGLLGQGASGIGGTFNVVTPGNWGKTGSPPSAGLTPGGGNEANGAGGDLRWKNNIAVTPGETLTVSFAVGNYPGQSANYFPAARLMWGGSRSYPNNAPDAIPAGQQTLTATNTTFTVPDKVTSICACAQQLHGGSAAVTLVVSGATVLRAQNGNRLGDGGGDGGSIVGNQGGGGAGGYSDSGGNSGANGSGGGGAGGAAAYLVENPSGPVFGGANPNPTYSVVPATNGGGVGISGAGASGIAPSGSGSPDPVNGYMGGGVASAGNASGNGGALAYKNAIAVTPGQVLTVNAAGGRVRIIWGPGRSYPSNAGNV